MVTYEMSRETARARVQTLRRALVLLALVESKTPDGDRAIRQVQSELRRLVEFLEAGLP